MRQLECLVQLCLIWYFIKIIKTHGEMLSKENIFQLQKHPAVNRYGDDVIKNISKICYDYKDNHEDDHNDDETAMGTSTYGRNNDNNDKNNINNTTKIFNIFENILQQIQNRECKQIEKKEVQKVRESDFQLMVQQRAEELRQSQYEVQPFSILQQLRLDEQQQKWQQEKQKEQLKLQQQPSALKLQQILQNINTESLGKAGKKKKKKRKKKRRKKKKPVKKKKKKQKPQAHDTSLQAHPAQILFASPTQRPLHYYHQHGDNDHYHQQTINTKTTKNPLLPHPLIPIKKIKYILRKNTIFKKKKKEYLNHLKHVLYPFVKFIAFFTIINPFTLAVFIFSLISPVVFGFLGFIGLSFLIKPALNILFGLKHTVNTIKRKKLQQLRRRQRLRNSRRPITIHKHYYQRNSLTPAPPLLVLKPKASLRYSRPPGNPPQHHQHHVQQIKLFNPLLPAVRQKLKKEKYFRPDIKEHNDSFEQF